MFKRPLSQIKSGLLLDKNCEIVNKQRSETQDGNTSENLFVFKFAFFFPQQMFSTLIKSEKIYSDSCKNKNLQDDKKKSTNPDVPLRHRRIQE